MLDDETPRHEHSHSASLGKRYFSPLSFSSGNADSFFRKSCASSQLTCPTGKSSVFIPATLSLPSPPAQKKLGLLPSTARHCACVTGKTPRENAFVISTSCCGPSER